MVSHSFRFPGETDSYGRARNQLLQAEIGLDGALKRTFARARGWNRVRLLSSAGNNYHRDYYGENSDGGQQPSLNVFVRRNGKIHHFFHSELLLVPSGAGQNQRHVDMIWPLWNLLDFTPEGRGSDWYPSLSYR
jgi:predicted dithiol-disulfide oxidoreductase (DUF899 family)